MIGYQDSTFWSINPSSRQKSVYFDSRLDRNLQSNIAKCEYVFSQLLDSHQSQRDKIS